MNDPVDRRRTPDRAGGDSPPPPEAPAHEAQQVQDVQELQEVSSAAQFAALAHPLRQRLLFVLGQRSATVSGLAVQLDARKGTVAHHLKVLREAGLVRIAETRRVRGGTEQRYRRTARRLLVHDPAPEGTAAMLTAVAQEAARSPAETAMTLRHLRLTPSQAAELGETLTRLVDEAEEAPEGEPVHSVLVALYRQAPPPADG